MSEDKENEGGVQDVEDEPLTPLPKTVAPSAPTRDYYLVIDATQTEPDFMGIFMENGGQINAAATKWDTDFAASSATESVVKVLDQHEIEHDILIPLASERLIGELSAKQRKDGIPVVILPADMRLNISTSRIGAAINGTLVSSVSGQGSEYIYNILKPGPNGHAQVGLVYASWLAHGASVGISGAHVVGVDKGADPRDDGVMRTRVNVGFVKRDGQNAMLLKGAAMIIQEYVKISYAMRQQLVYAPSPMLTTSVYKDPVGVDGQGYNLVHDIVDRGSPFGLDVLDSLFQAGIENDCCQDSKTISSFIEDTASPGLKAAKQARVVASAASLVVNYLVAYRADGRNVVSVMGADFAPAESWLRQLARGPIDANDCDGSALMAIGLVNAAVNISDEEAEKYKYLKAVKNAVYPYYHLALSVVGATAAEATSADGEAEHVAGHAIAVMIPTINLLRAMSKPMLKKIGSTNQTVCPTDKRKMIEEARFNALFPAWKMSAIKLPPGELDQLKTWGIAEAHEEFKELHPWAMEGTTPSSPVMYVPDASRRSLIEADVDKDDKAFAKASPNVFRSIKILHVGGSSAGSTHRFYRDLVEFTFSRKSPFYTDPILRNFNAAASQFVLSRAHDQDAVSSAGATPKDIVMRTACRAVGRCEPAA